MSFRQFFSSKLRADHSTFVGKNGSITYYNGNLYFHDGRTPGGLRIDQDTGASGDALATEAYVDGRIDQVIGMAPAALDTLKELADALGNDADFATSLTNLLADKASVIYVDNQISNVVSTTNTSLATKASITYVDLELGELADAINASINSIQAAIDAEVLDRAAADNTLQNNINAEASDRAAADTVLQNNINAEATARATADNNLQTSINSLTSSLSAESVARQNADDALDSLIDAEVAARQQADGNLAGDIADETAARISADNALQTAIDLEATARSNADTAIQVSLATETADRQAADETLQDNIDAEVAARGAAINSEATVRANADNALQTAINNEASARAQGDQDLQDNLDAVEASYIAADAGLTAQITQEVSDRISAVSAESSARAAADENLQDQIDFIKENIDPAAIDSLKEIVDAFQTNGGDIANNIATINTTLVTLQGADSTEAAARAAADETLQDNIDAEALARQSADASLQSQIDNIVSNIDPAQLDSLSEIVAAFQTADGSLTTTINNLQTTLQGNVDAVAGDLAAETTNRTNADLALQSNIDTEASTRAAADETLQDNIDAEATARANAVNSLQSSLNTEISDRQAADTLLQTNIDNEATARQESDTSILASLAQEVTDRQTAVSGEALARQAADTTLQNNIDAEALARQGADSTLQSNIDAEATARQSADTTLQNNIDAEALARQGADSTLQSNIDTEEAARIAADTTLQTNISNEAIDRIAGDANLQSQIDSIKSNLDPAALDSLTEIVTAFQSGDTNLLSDLSNVSTALNTKLNTADFDTTADSWLGTKTMFTITDTPTNSTDATNKAYVDSQISGLSTSSISNGSSSASLPDADGDFVVSLNGGAADWTFGTTGGITFPDGTVQTTAYPSGDQYGFINQYVHSSTDNVDMEAVVMDSAGNSYVSYSYYDNNENRRYGGIVKLDSTGSVQWNQNLQSSNTNGEYPQIASLEYATINGTDYLVAIGTYYDNSINKDRGFMWLVNPTNGSVGSEGDFETNGDVPVRLTDAVFGLDGNDSPFAVVVGDTYNEILPKIFTPLAGSSTDKLVVSWAEFNASGVQPGEWIYYNVGGSYGIRLNSFDTVASLDGTGGGLYLQVSINQNGTYSILRANGWSGVIYGWGNPVNVRVLGSNLGGVDGVNDLTFDLDTNALNNNSNNVAGWASNIQGTAISDVVGFGWGGKDWSTEVGNPITFEYQLNRQAYIARLGNNSWSKSIGGSEYEELNTVVVDANGNSYVGGYYWNGNKASLVAKLDIDGNQQWAVHIDSPNNTGNNVTSIDLLSDGNLIAVDEEGFVTKINSSDGSIIWQVRVDPSNNISWNSDFRGTATPDGNYIFTNYEDNDYTMYVLCVSGTDGSEVWSKRITRNFAGSNGEIYPMDDFNAQYIDCNATSVTIAASTYLYFNNQSTYAGLVINFPVTGENTNGVYGQYIIESATPGWNTESTTSTSATVISQSSPVTVTGVAPTASANTFTATVTNIGGSGGILGNFTFTGNSLYNGLAEIKVVPDSSGDGAGYTTIELRPDSNASQDQYLIIDPTAPNHIHIRAGGTQDSSNADLFLGGEKNFVKVSDPVDLVEIGVDNNNGGNWSWQFNSSGQLAVPGAVNFLQNSTIPLGAPQVGGATDRVRLWDFFGGGSGFNYAIGAEGNHVWFAMDVNDGTGGFKFYSRDNQVFKIRDDGALMFADATTQTTAYPGTSILDGYATETFVNNAVAAVVDSAPEVLNTLNELAAALGDNPDFVTTITGQIGLKANSADVYLKTETYSQNEIDDYLSLKADALATNNALASKADAATTYTKTEVDNSLALKVNSADLATVATSGDYDDLIDRIEYSTLGELVERTVQVGAGTLSYTPTIETGIIAAGNHTGSYAGLTVQNQNAGNTSSANIYFSNTGATETDNFAVIGLNGPNYDFGYDSVDGAKKLLYIANTDGDITLIPNYYGTGNIHLGYGNGAAAISVTHQGGLSLGTTWNNAGQAYVLNEGAAGQILTSGGAGQPVTWSTPAAQNQLVDGSTSLTLDSSGKITLPQGSVINESGSVNCDPGTATTIYTATSDAMTTVKVLVQVEQFVGPTQIQSSEIMVVKAFGTSTVMSSTYGTVYSGTGPLATFTAELDGSNKIVIKCEPTGANNIFARVIATEIVTSD